MTDRYELTMIDAALRSGTAFRPSAFEVFARRLPGARRYGVVAGTGRFLERLAEFRFGDAQLAFLRDERVVSAELIEWLADYRFSGDIRGYAEGEAYFPGSPILVVEGSFAEAVVLETVALSVLNYDSAVANAATRMHRAAKGRPLAEMGSRRASEESAIAAARAAYIAGFGATSNLAAGARWGIPTMGTAAHSFTLLHDSEAEAFQAQIDTLGVGTTLLVDTYDIEQGIRTAIEVAGPRLGGIRLDSGDLADVAAEARALLDSLGATETRITVTSDLDEYAIAGLQASPVDAYGVGTSVVTGSGAPAAGMVYKLVSRQGDDGQWVGVGKRSEDKASQPGEKVAVRTLEHGVAVEETVLVGDDPATLAAAAERGRPLQVPLVRSGEIQPEWLGHGGVELARQRHAASVEELPAEAHRLARGEPAIPTVFR
ncbi:nicotinate phosphoribosyltransferase [Agrococcus sp. Marseille-Q4369]|uniref:nicotinate phosphoribosyltransferase n=1 Tax=Agrococcus sp. Marseille-Q4369 TaxID=2810513 RepID=UPI001B8BEA7E|nr:nicotinate phosphoribosyltransferase [Agrococcus sp. Marseille-Q4369]QUW19986.1 nicotinate phosphoribosyltransferase [Agrococcus sp. Marseille-Q4369]